MKIGDLVRYRDRRPTDPLPDGRHDGWGLIGIVMRILEEPYGPNGEREPSIEYVDSNGDWIICKQEDVEVINESR